MIEKDGIPFWPDAASKDVVFAITVGVVVLVLAIIVGPATLGPKADPTNINADPRPDWYFLWYFALLALMPPEIENIFIIGFPLLVVGALIALPLWAPAGERSPLRRPWAVGVVGFTSTSVAILVWYGWQAPWSPDFHPQPLPASATTGLNGDAVQGAQLFQTERCIACHSIAGDGGKRGPDLTDIGTRLSPDDLTWRIASGGSNMPAYRVNLQPDEMKAVVDFLSQEGRTQ